VGARRPCEVVEAQAQHDGAARAAGRSHPAGDAVDQADEHRVQRLRRVPPAAEGALRPDRAPPPTRAHRPGIAVVGQGVDVAARRRPEDRRQRALAGAGGIADGGDGAGVQPRGGGRADAPQPLHRERVQEGQLVLGRHHEQAVGLGHRAGHLGQRPGARHADGDRQADALADLAAQAHRDLLGRARDPLQPADVEERLVDRQLLDPRRGLREDLEHRSARFHVRLELRRHDDRLRAQTPGLPGPHRRPDAVRAGLVAGREHDPRPHDHGLAEQPRVVALGDRREEGIEVGVQDRRLA
jgi:hypothetical protein